MIRPLLLVATAALALTACGDDPAPVQQGDDNRRAEGEVQGGSISDAMIPLDTLTSQSPPMKRRPVSGDDAGSGEEAEPDAGTSEDAPPEPAESAEPAAEPAEAPIEPIADE